MDIKCFQCGKKIYGVTKRRKFCSNKCADAYRYVVRPKKGKFKKCAYCGSEVWTPVWRFKFENRFCNREHQILFYKDKAFHKNCVICGKVFYCQPCQIKYRNRQTCSVACRSKLITLKAKDNRIKNGFTKHQTDRCIRYSKECDDWRVAVFKRDDWTCQTCGARSRPKESVYLEAHHLKPFAYFPKLRFELSNGITLCKECHNKTKVSASKMKILYQDLGAGRVD